MARLGGHKGAKTTTCPTQPPSRSFDTSRPLGRASGHQKRSATLYFFVKDFLFFLARALWRLYIIPLKSSKTHASASNHLLHLVRTKSFPSRIKQANPFRFRNVSLNALIDWPYF